MIIVTVIILICIVFSINNVEKISKFNRQYTKNILLKKLVMLIISYLCGIVCLAVMLGLGETFDLFKYIGICTYWLFAILAFFSWFGLLVYAEKINESTSLDYLSSDFTKKAMSITILAVLWVISNTLLDCSKIIIFSLPAVMMLVFILVTVRYIVLRNKIISK